MRRRTGSRSLGAVRAVFANFELRRVELAYLHMTEVRSGPGTALVREGEIGHHLYVIEDGEVEVIHDGRPVAALGRGDYFGEIALLRHVPTTATVVAKTPATLLSIEREGFLEEVTGHPVVRKTADVMVQARLREDEDVDAGSGET